MSYRTILVHVNDERRADNLLRHATTMAEKHEAHLIGIYAAPQPIVYADWPGAGLGEVLDQIRREHATTAEKLRVTFEAATRSLRASSEWRFTQSFTASIADDVMDCGRSADLIMASQADAEWAQSGDMDVPDRLAIESGRPVLMIPNNGIVPKDFKRITVGWNAKREAARAVFDALPLLKDAQSVNIVWVGPSSAAGEGDMPGSELCRTLSRHGVKCEASWVDALDNSAGLELLRQAKGFGSDLLVVGAYGHSRVRQFVLGGASRDVFKTAPIPVLWSH